MPHAALRRGTRRCDRLPRYRDDVRVNSLVSARTRTCRRWLAGDRGWLRFRASDFLPGFCRLRLDLRSTAPVRSCLRNDRTLPVADLASGSTRLFGSRSRRRRGPATRFRRFWSRFRASLLRADSNFRARVVPESLLACRLGDPLLRSGALRPATRSGFCRC